MEVQINCNSVFLCLKVCIFCDKKMSKSHLCADLYIYNILYPMFYKVFYESDWRTVSEFIHSTLDFVKTSKMFELTNADNCEMDNVICTFSKYFLEDLLFDI